MKFDLDFTISTLILSAHLRCDIAIPWFSLQRLKTIDTLWCNMGGS